MSEDKIRRKNLFLLLRIVVDPRFALVMMDLTPDRSSVTLYTYIFKQNDATKPKHQMIHQNKNYISHKLLLLHLIRLI